jgi:hypothetical protein
LRSAGLQPLRSAGLRTLGACIRTHGVPVIELTGNYDVMIVISP